jgi:hypothetical protein
MLLHFNHSTDYKLHSIVLVFGPYEEVPKGCDCLETVIQNSNWAAIFKINK